MPVLIAFTASATANNEVEQAECTLTEGPFKFK